MRLALPVVAPFLCSLTSESHHGPDDRLPHACCEMPALFSLDQARTGISTTHHRTGTNAHGRVQSATDALQAFVAGIPVLPILSDFCTDTKQMNTSIPPKRSPS